MTRRNRFNWYELYTSDPEAAIRFYGAVVGWSTKKWDGGLDYTMWVAPGGPIGGVVALPDEAKAMGAGPHWVGYVGVENAADIASRVTSRGGTVQVPPTDLPGGARFAILADPQGATFGVHQAAVEEQEAKRGLGDFSWAELITSDLDAGFAFYADLFGWVKTDTFDMGEMGAYQLFGRSKEEGSIGGMMRRPPHVPASHWLHYANVADVDAVAPKIAELGGKILYPPMDVPGGGRVTAAIDPQGASFAAFAEKK